MEITHKLASDRLTNAQRIAWQHVVSAVNGQQAEARARVTRLLDDADCPQSLLDTVLNAIRQHARVVLHFHPDRIGAESMTVAEGQLRHGQYRSQFETGLSNGSTTAHPGGPRDEWERALFGGAYHHQDATVSDRPKYGALELIRYPDGPIDLSTDVERLVADPAFRGTPTGDRLNELCHTYGIALHWHCGFRLAASDVPEDFRGPAVRKLARRIADNGVVDAAVIGAAQQSLCLRPTEWQDWGPTEETLQHLKQLWHVLVHHGR